MRTRSKLSILLSILLCCTMLAGLLPTVAFAEDSTTVSSENGAGTVSYTHLSGRRCGHRHHGQPHLEQAGDRPLYGRLPVDHPSGQLCPTGSGAGLADRTDSGGRRGRHRPHRPVQYGLRPVSYTHLDVYKRQPEACPDTPGYQTRKKLPCWLSSWPAESAE